MNESGVRVRLPKGWPLLDYTEEEKAENTRLATKSLRQRLQEREVATLKAIFDGEAFINVQAGQVVDDRPDQTGQADPTHPRQPVLRVLPGENL